MPGTIIVAGVPGVGKTTILRELENLARSRKTPLKIVNFGNVMNQLFRKSGNKINRDQMRRLDIGLQSRVQREAARGIRKLSGESTLIVDTHMFVKTADGIWPGTPKAVLDHLDPRMIVLIEADPRAIAKRRSIDASRHRDSRTLSEVKEDLEWSRCMASINAVLAGVPVRVVQNRDRAQRQAARDLLRTIERLT